MLAGRHASDLVEGEVRSDLEPAPASGIRRNLRWPSSAVAGPLDSPGGAAVHEHATRVPAPEEYEHGRLAGVALRLAEHRRSPKLLLALATFGSPDESMPIRHSAAASGRAFPTGAAIESRRRAAHPRGAVEISDRSGHPSGRPGRCFLVLCESEADVAAAYRHDPIVSKVTANALAGKVQLSAQSGDVGEDVVRPRPLTKEASDECRLVLHMLPDIHRSFAGDRRFGLGRIARPSIDCRSRAQALRAERPTWLSKEPVHSFWQAKATAHQRFDGRRRQDGLCEQLVPVGNGTPAVPERRTPVGAAVATAQLSLL
jgi:hypothetical protein